MMEGWGNLLRQAAGFCPQAVGAVFVLLYFFPQFGHAGFRGWRAHLIQALDRIWGNRFAMSFVVFCCRPRRIDNEDVWG